MSQPSQIAPTSLSEGHSVTNLTAVVLLLIPCVVALLLLNCFFLGYKLLALSKKRSRPMGGAEEVLLQRVRVSDVAFSPLHSRRRPYASLSEPVLPHPVTSSRASSRASSQEIRRMRLLTPDGATGGSGSPRAPSSIPATFSSFCVGRVIPRVTPRVDPALNKAGWCRSAPRLLQSSDSEAEARVNPVPPNSPMATEHVALFHRSSNYHVLADVNPDVAGREFSKAGVECIEPPLQTSCLSTSAVGPGLDSDFGASAGVSLRILSADSDGLSSGVLTSALEWDYYDPCYVRQNNVPKHQHHRPALHTKHYWV